MEYNSTISQTNEFSLAKVFGWLFMALGVTALSAYGFAALLSLGFVSPEAYLGVMIGSIILMIVETFIIQYRVLKDNKPLTIPFVIYAITMGLMMSSIVLVIDSKLLIVSFGISAALFGVMALYGYLTKRSLNRMASMCVVLLLGALVISLINIFLRSTTIDWIVSFVTFGVIMLFISIDMWRIKTIIDSGINSRNLCQYCAFELYVDFMYLFLRVLQYVAIFSSDRR